jgi:hypothetical protein
VTDLVIEYHLQANVGLHFTNRGQTSGWCGALCKIAKLYTKAERRPKRQQERMVRTAIIGWN